MSKVFLPVIPPTSTSDTKSDLRRIWRGAARTCLANEACAAAISTFKANGSINGHKVLDNAAAVTALIEAAPKELKGILQMEGLKLFDKTQALDVVLRARFEMNKKGKLTGNDAPRYLLKLAKNKEGSQA